MGQRGWVAGIGLTWEDGIRGKGGREREDRGESGGKEGRENANDDEFILLLNSR